MRKFTFVVLFMALAIVSRSQTLSFSLVTAPCHNDGLLTINATGLTPPLTVSWTTYGSSGTTITHTGVTGLFDALTGYSGGPVYVSATDGTNTAINSYGGTPPFYFSVAATAEVCPTPGSASVSVSGGTPPYTYQWYNLATSGIVGTTSPISLLTGQYGVMITDAAGCTYGTEDDNIDTASSAIVGYIAPYTVSLNATTANCTNGTASVVSVSAGAALPVTYLWNNGATTAAIAGLTTGFYSVVVTDALGCVSDSISSGIYVPQSVIISAPVTATPASCLDTNGAVITFGSGGTPPYTYLWNNGSIAQSQTGLAAGYYSVLATDANGCIGSGAAYVTVSTPITVTYSSTPSLCTSATGNATLVPAGGTAPYTVLWYTAPPQTTPTATTLSAGNYNFKVTDAVGCVQTGTVTVPPIDIISLSFSSTPALCTLSNGNLNVTAVGGVAPYTYSWSTGATTSGLTGVPSGTYALTVTDAMSCSVTKYPYLPDYSPVSLGVSTTPASCIFTNDGMLTAVAMGGTAPYSYGWSTGGTTASITGLPYGPYWSYVTDASGCTANNYTWLPFDSSATDCYCTISGTIYNDTNSNCVQDPGEPGINNIQVYCSGIGYTYTDASGHYSFLVPSGTYTVSETVLAFYPLASCQSNAIVVTAAATAGCVLTANFANTMDTIHDMHISTWDYSFPVIGNSYTQVTTISNDGTVEEDSVLAIYADDGQLLAPSFMPSGVFTGTGGYHTTAAGFPAIVPGQTSTFYMTYNVPTDVPIGTVVNFHDSIAYKAPLDNWLTDYSPWNNVNNLSTNTVAAYDPNFKEVSPKGAGPTGLITYADSTLEYMVHFQNTGTAPAQNIIVVDTLDNNLDWTTLRPEYMSAACKVTLQQVGSLKIAKFTFNNIFLPTKTTNDLRSNGMFTYTIKTMPGLPVGTQFRNRASIYFDYNAPIRTNQTLNTLGAPATTAISNTTIEQKRAFSIYPNPANSSFYSVINSSASVSAEMNISDVTGKVLISKTIALQKGAQTISTSINALSPGVYFVTLNNNGKTETQKLVVIK
jgi:uncharacterized repeat protein (TIGR01451 family)